MEKMNIKFKTQLEFDKFIQYLKLPNCEINRDELIIRCIVDPIELRIATQIFNAEIIK